MAALRRLRWERGDPDADAPRGAADVLGPVAGPLMSPYDGLVFGVLCRVCAQTISRCICRDYRGLRRPQCAGGLFFPTLRTKNAWIVLRKNTRRVRSRAHQTAWRLWRACQKDLILYGHPVLRKDPANANDPRVGNHVYPFLSFVLRNRTFMGTPSCVVCDDWLAANCVYNICNTCKAWRPFQDYFSAGRGPNFSISSADDDDSSSSAVYLA